LDFGYVVVQGLFPEEIMFWYFVNLCNIEGFYLKGLGPTGELFLSMSFLKKELWAKNICFKSLEDRM
jgi:hypothetical protein